MAQQGLKCLLCCILFLGISFNKLYSAKIPLKLDRFKTLNVEAYDSKVINTLVPQNLNIGDDPTYVILKFIGHNLKNLRDAEFSVAEKEKTKSTITPYVEIYSKNPNIYKLHKDLDLEFKFNADWGRHRLKMYMISGHLKGEMAYVLGSNQILVAVSKNTSSRFDFSLMNIKELSTGNNLLALNLSFNL